MTIKTEYSIGQRVRFRRHGMVTKSEVCGFCSGQKIIIGHDGSVEHCPHCNGNGFIERECPGVNEGEGTISNMRIYCFKDRTDIFYRTEGDWDNIWFREDEVSEVLE